MVSRFAIIATIGLTISAICMGAAAAIGDRGLSGMDFSLFDGGPRCNAVAGATGTSRTIAWDGSDHAGMAIGATANYAPGSGDSVRATGDPQVLAHLRVRDGTVELDCRGWNSRDTDVIITLPGRTFQKFVLAGTGKMNLDRLDQSSLKVEIAGIGTVKANGKVGDLRIEMAGVGKADFGQVIGRTVRLEMAGVGKADIAPSDEAHIEMAGPGEVTLHSDPKKLDTEIFGPGRIHKAGPAS